MTVQLGVYLDVQISPVVRPNRTLFHQQVGQGDIRARQTLPAGFDQPIGVDQPALESEQTKKQVTICVHDRTTQKSTDNRHYNSRIVRALPPARQDLAASRKPSARAAEAGGKGKSWDTIPVAILNGGRDQDGGLP